MSHILMAVAASSGGPKVQRCHTGASVMVCPVAEPNAEATAILSTCIFASPAAWAEASRRGKTFGLDQGALRKAFQALPHISDSRRRLIETAMKAMSLAVLEINRRIATEARLQSLEQANASRVDLSQLLHKTDWALAGETPAPDATEDGRAPLLVRVVCELVRQRPEMPLTIKELAAAARVTPNHLTTIFAQRTGQSFTRFLAEQRLLRAKELLGDLTLHVNEIARRVGYDDPGYFARRFRQLTGLSPREWRQRRPGGDSANSGR
jgi:AraC-like DNA-binding protein